MIHVALYFMEYVDCFFLGASIHEKIKDDSWSGSTAAKTRRR